MYDFTLPMEVHFISTITAAERNNQGSGYICEVNIRFYVVLLGTLRKIFFKKISSTELISASIYCDV